MSKEIVPWRKFDSLVDGLFDEFRGDFFDRMEKFFKGDFFPVGWKDGFPKVNLSEEDDRYVVEIGIAGFKKDDVDLSLEDNILTIEMKACEEKKEEDKKKKFHLKELSCRNFKRQFHLPYEVDGEKVSAEYKDGVITAVLPFKEDVKKETVKKIEVR